MSIMDSTKLITDKLSLSCGLEIIEDLIRDEYKSMLSGIKYSFIWSGTVQGTLYWSSITRDINRCYQRRKRFSIEEKMEIMSELLLIVEREE